MPLKFETIDFTTLFSQLHDALHGNLKFPEYRGQYIPSKHLYRDIITNNGIYNSAKIQEYLGKHGNTRDAFPRGKRNILNATFQGGALYLHIKLSRQMRWHHRKSQPGIT